MADAEKVEKAPTKSAKKSIKQVLAPFRKTYPELKAQFDDFIEVVKTEDARKIEVAKEKADVDARRKEIKSMANQYNGLSESERAMFDELRHKDNAA